MSITPVAAVHAAPLATRTGHNGSGSDLLWWLAAIGGALVLARGGATLRRRRLRQRQEANRRRLNAEWKAALRRIEQERAPAVSHLEVARIQRVELESPQGDPAPAEGARHDPARAGGG